MLATLSYTPYHLLQALSLAPAGTEARHVWVTDAKATRDMVERLRGSGVAIVAGRFGKGWVAHRLAARRIAAQTLRHMAPLEDITTLLVGSDLVPDAHRVVHAVLARSPSCRAGVLEDGIGLYLPPRPRGDSALRRLLRRLGYGRHFRPPAGVGRSGWVRVVYATRPELVDWAETHKVTIRPEALRLWEESHEAGAKLPARCMLVLGPNPDNPAYPRLFESMMRLADEHSGPVAVKLHPRDPAKLGGRFLQLPRNLPAEVVAARSLDAIAAVVTTFSTPLYSIPDLARSRCSVTVVGPANPDLERLAARLNPQARYLSIH